MDDIKVTATRRVISIPHTIGNGVSDFDVVNSAIADELLRALVDAKEDMEWLAIHLDSKVAATAAKQIEAAIASATNGRG